MTAHPLKAMIDRGLVVTVNSDDPAYFGGYMNDNYYAVRQALGLSDDELAMIARNSFGASFLDETAKERHIAEVDAYVASADSSGTESSARFSTSLRGPVVASLSPSIRTWCKTVHPALELDRRTCRER